MTLTAPAAEGVIYYVRVLPATTDYTESGTVTWSSGPRLYDLVVRVGGPAGPEPMDSGPGFLTVTVSNGEPLDNVYFYVDDGSAIFGSTLDDGGQLVGISVPIPAIAAGSHTLRATTPTTSGSASFQVTNETPAYPDSPGVDVEPVAVAQDGVVRWVLQDPTTGGEEYIFPISPSKMSTPYAARMFTTDHSTAPDGQPLMFEGSAVGVDWNMEGVCRTEAFHDALERFLALPRRVYLIDHLSRAWTVTLEGVTWTRLREAYNDWAFTYQLKAIIYAGPLDLS